MHLTGGRRARSITEPVTEERDVPPVEPCHSVSRLLCVIVPVILVQRFVPTVEARVDSQLARDGLQILADPLEATDEIDGKSSVARYDERVLRTDVLLARHLRRGQQLDDELGEARASGDGVGDGEFGCPAWR